MGFRVFRKSLSSLSDEELIKRFDQTRDQQYLAEVYNRYLALLYGICLKYLPSREEAQDAVSEIYEVLEAKVSNQQISNFSSWLHSVARNHCLMVLRKKDRTNTALTNLFQEIRMENGTGEHQTSGGTEEVFLELEREISDLPEGQSECIRLFFYENKSYKEIELVTGYDLKKVKSHIQNGKRNLKLSIRNNVGYG